MPVLMPLKTVFVGNAFVDKQFCLAGNKPSLLQGNSTIRKGAGWALEENYAGACWSDALAGFTDAQGLNMGWELCPLPGQTLVP